MPQCLIFSEMSEAEDNDGWSHLAKSDITAYQSVLKLRSCRIRRGREMESFVEVGDRLCQQNWTPTFVIEIECDDPRYGDPRTLHARGG